MNFLIQITPSFQVKKELPCKCEERFVISNDTRRIVFEKAIAIQSNILLSKLVYETYNGFKDTSIQIYDLKSIVSDIQYKM